MYFEKLNYKKKPISNFFLTIAHVNIYNSKFFSFSISNRFSYTISQYVFSSYMFQRFNDFIYLKNIKLFFLPNAENLFLSVNRSIFNGF